MPELVSPDVWVKGGLLDAKHRAKMGEAVWLYLHIQQLVRFSGDDAGTTPESHPYKHSDAAGRLGLSVRAVKYHLETLVEEGYVKVAKRLPYGLLLTITKYPDAVKRAAERKRREVQTTASPEVQSVAQRSATERIEKCNPASGEVQRIAPLYKEDKRTKRPNEPKEGARARVLTEHQAIVNAYYEGLGRDPFTARDYGRHVAAGAELHDNGTTPQDVRNCTKWMWSNPWRRSNGKVPALAEVAAALPGWIEDRRPGRYTAPPREGPESGATKMARYVANRHQARSDQRALTGH